MPTLIDGLAISDAVYRDGLPRRAEDDEGNTHILYLNDDNLVQSKLLSEWTDPVPSNPTQQQIDDAIELMKQNNKDKQDKLLLARMRALSLASSSVGIRVDDLNTPQLKALIGLLLWKEGAIDSDGIVLPLDKWIR
jgi:hypothetical protein